MAVKFAPSVFSLSDCIHASLTVLLDTDGF